MDKSWSFSSRKSTNVGSGQQWEFGEQEDDDHRGDLPLPQVLADVDRFLNDCDTSTSPTTRDVPDCVLVLPKLLDSMIDKHNNNNRKSGRRIKFGQDPEDDKSFLDVVDRISKLSNTLSSTTWSASYLDKDKDKDKTSSFVLEKAMTILENDLCALLQNPKYNVVVFQSKTRPAPRKSSSFGSLQHLLQLQVESEESPSCWPAPYGGGDHHADDEIRNNIINGDEDYLPAFSTENISILNKIATAMISAGYQTECCMAFANFRRNAFKTALQKFGYAAAAAAGGVRLMDEVYRMQWESLEGEIAMWNRVVRHCTTVFFKAERRLYDSVFPNQPSISQSLFGDLARTVIIQFLNFAQAVVLTKPSPEKLFKMLDMYETLRDDVEPIINIIVDDDSYSYSYSYSDQRYCSKAEEPAAYEVAAAKDRIIEAVMAMFCVLENSIKSDNERIPVPYGAVHPLTRYVMNYLKYACEYKDTLEQVFQLCRRRRRLTDDDIGGSSSSSSSSTRIQNNTTKNNHVEVNGTPKEEYSPYFAVQSMTIMDLLDANIERKSKLYRDPALRYVFLMNNGRYIVQKIKGCTELHESMGDNWCRRRQSGLRLYHKSYQRETWSKVLQCLNPAEGGLQQQGSSTGRNKVSKQVLKERFKCFNAMFEEIHKTQSCWMVSDEQLQSELRVSISALIIPAYRSFLGRFKHHFDSGTHIDKYIKYHPEDIEVLVDDFFGGNATSMARRGT